jgi:hypothetical protein
MADTNRPNIETGTSGTSGTTRGTFSGDWNRDESWWRDNWRNRPYATADRGFDYYSPAYRYAYDSRTRYAGRDWNDVEGDLRMGWEKFESKTDSTWENIKDAVRDAWDRLTNRDDFDRVR